MTILKKMTWALLLVPAFVVSAQNVRAENLEHKKETVNRDSIFTAREVFKKLQSSALELLPTSTRLDMLDYWDVDSTYKAMNVMEGLSWLEDVKETYLKVRISNVSTLEIKILPDKKTKIAMTIYTIGDDVQAQDSRLQFFDENLTEMPADKFIKVPELKNFFEIPKGSATKMKELEDMIPFPTIAFSANPDNNDLKAWLTVEKYINQDDWNIAKLFVKPFVTLHWEKEKYHLEK